MGTIGNNADGNIGYVRDSFFTEGEQDYFEKLMRNPDERRIHFKLARKNAQELFDKAMELIDRVEAGEFNEEQMQKAERAIVHLLAGIEDLQKVLELEREIEL